MAIVPHDSLPGKVCSSCREWHPLSEFTKLHTSSDGHGYQCRACRRARRRAEYERNRDKYIARARKNEFAFRERDPEGYRALKRDVARRHYHKDAVRSRKLDKEYRARNRDAVNAYARAQYRKNPEPQKVASRKRARFAAHKRRARIHANGGELTAAQWRGVCARYDHKCLCCGVRKPLTIDHVLPLSMGGSNDVSNIQPLCLECNLQKGTRYIDYRRDDLTWYRQITLWDSEETA